MKEQRIMTKVLRDNLVSKIQEFLCEHEITFPAEQICYLDKEQTPTVGQEVSIHVIELDAIHQGSNFWDNKCDLSNSSATRTSATRDPENEKRPQLK